MKKLNKDNGGFSLAEVIVAVVILGIITVPLLHTMLTGANTARKSAEAQDINNAAQSLVELVRAKGVSTVYDSPEKLYAGAVGDDNSLDTIQTINISDFTSGSRHYAAEVEIDAGSADNSEPLAKSNPMDITVDMKYADNRAMNQYRNDCRVRVPILDEDGNEIGSYYEYPDKSRLDRSGIDIEAVRQPGSEDTFIYTVTVTFHYSAEAYGAFRAYSCEAASSVTTGSLKVPEFGDAVFSLYLIYNAYFRSGDAVTILNEYEDCDYNVFLVNSSTETQPTGMCSIYYRNQIFSGGKTCQRVFANLAPGFVSYHACATGKEEVFSIGGELVETKAERRRYTVTVTLTDSRGGQTSLEAEMLD